MTIDKDNHISNFAFHTDRIIQCFIISRFQVASNLLEGMFMNTLLAEHISCCTVDSISNVRAYVSSKIQ